MLRTPFQSPSPYTDLMGKRDINTFFGVFSVHNPSKARNKYGEPQYQKWCRSVLEVFAEKMEIPFSVAVQSFKTGKPLAIRRWHARRILSRLDENGQEQRYVHPIGEMSDDDFLQKFHRDWCWCLLIRHPDENAYVKVMHTSQEAA